MRKQIKKTLAWLGTAIMTVGILAVPTFSAKAAVDVDSLEDGTAYLSINNSEWGDFDATYENALIEGDGQYTVSMEASEAQDLAQFNALQVKNGESVLGSGVILTVDEIKLNGEAIELQGDSYTCSADGAGIDTRVNLYNEWNSPVDDNGVVGEDVRAEVDPTTATATLWTSDQLTGVTSVEVTFTVSHYGEEHVANGAGSGIDVSGQEAVAKLNINNADWGEYDKEDVTAVITGDGQYTVSMTAAEPQDLAQFNALEVENGELIMGNGVILTIDEIKLNGEAIELQGDSYTCSADGAGITTRVNLYNEWNSPVDDSGAVAADVRAVTDPASATAMLWTADQLTGVSSVEVTFTVSDYGVFFETEEEPSASLAEVNKDGEYNAYILIQTPKYSFRNAWYDDYGMDYSDDSGFDYFNQITGWDSESNAVSLPGKINDAKIAGNGTYTVSITGLEFPDDEFSSQDHFNLIAIDTDIPNTGEITISDISLAVNGTGVDIHPIISPDSEEWLTMLIQNIWNDEVAEIGYTPTPVTDISITFTVSGFNYEKAADDTDTTVEENLDTTEAPEVTAEKSGPNVGLIIGIVCGCLVIVGLVVFFIVRAKKK